MIGALQLSSRSMAFWQWWSAELIELWGMLLSAVAPGLRTAIAVAITSDRLNFVMSQGADLEVPRIEPGADWAAADRDKLAVLLQSCRRVQLLFPDAEAFRYRRVMPLAVNSYLHHAIALQLPKWMPLKVDILLTDHRVIRRDLTAGTIEIEVAALKRADVERLAKQIRSLGFRIKRIGLREPNDIGPTFSFSLRNAAPIRASTSRSERRMWAAAAVFGCIMILIGAIEGFRSQRSLAFNVQTIHTAVAEAAARRQGVIEHIEPLKALSALEAMPSSTALIVELTQLVPSDSWVTNIERRDRQIRIAGLSPDAAGVVNRLASSALLSEVSLRSSISAGIGTGLDRFEITAEFRPNSP